jgi:hypothetical protein
MSHPPEGHRDDVSESKSSPVLSGKGLYINIEMLRYAQHDKISFGKPPLFPLLMNKLILLF